MFRRRKNFFFNLQGEISSRIKPVIKLSFVRQCSKIIWIFIILPFKGYDIRPIKLIPIEIIYQNIQSPILLHREKR